LNIVTCCDTRAAVTRRSGVAELDGSGVGAGGGDDEPPLVAAGLGAIAILVIVRPASASVC